MDKNVSVYKEDKIIVRENKVTPYMCYVMEGSVALYLNYKTKDELLLGICGKGKVFSEMGMLNASPSLYTAVAITDNTTILEITQENFVEFIKKRPESAIGIMKQMSKINTFLKQSVDMLMEELMDKVDAQQRTKELSANIAKYSVRGIQSYIDERK